MGFGVRNNNDWESLIMYLLKGVEVTAVQTIDLVQDIKQVMQNTKQRLRAELPKIYSQDLLNNLFKNPYTKIEFLQRDLGVTNRTALNYLDTIANAGFISKIKVGKSNYYINEPLISVLVREKKDV